MAGIRGPEDLTGKNIGGLRWVQTAFIWLRGMLVDEHHLSAKDTNWYVSALHHWHELPHHLTGVVDNSIVDQLAEEKFFEKFSARNFADTEASLLLESF